MQLFTIALNSLYWDECSSMKCKKQLIPSQVSRALTHYGQIYFGDPPGEVWDWSNIYLGKELPVQGKRAWLCLWLVLEVSSAELTVSVLFGHAFLIPSWCTYARCTGMDMLWDSPKFRVWQTLKFSSARCTIFRSCASNSNSFPSISCFYTFWDIFILWSILPID